ncbi:MAG TPA: class I SAM-dependent methyltransferase [Candidatus Acidoferrales bacterium]|nr:class I SAM-dependent methyltransferase [Candidatus Acidoferrales bacterium]
MLSAKARTAIKRLVPRKYLPPVKEIYGLYAPRQVFCPCCGQLFSKFEPFGVRPRPNALCPGCGALERHRLLWLYLQRKTDFFRAPYRVLHIAPEEIYQRIFRRLPNLKYVSADLMSRNAMVRTDITELGFAEHSFDVVLCIHVLEHVVDEKRALAEIRRVLKPRGWAILLSPIDTNREVTFEDPSVTTPEDRLRIFGQSDHVRIYGRDYKERLERAGFTVLADPFAEHLGSRRLLRFGLVKSEVIYLCIKTHTPMTDPGLK